MLAKLLASNKKLKVWVRTAIPSGPGRLHVALNLTTGFYDDAMGAAVVEVDLSGDRPSWTVVCASAGFVVDFVRDARGRSVVLLRSQLVVIEDGAARIVDAGPRAARPHGGGRRHGRADRL